MVVQWGRGIETSNMFLVYGFALEKGSQNKGKLGKFDFEEIIAATSYVLIPKNTLLSI